jgi:formylglycine-generating enzyme required for sulfatase activity
MPQLGDRLTDPKGIAMVYVPAGQFLMGSDDIAEDEQPTHFQTISAGFWLDLTPLTTAHYAAFIADGGYQQQHHWTPDGWRWLQSQNITGPEDEAEFTDPDQPRVGINFYEAYAYGQWRGARLPTEAEWEWAARGPENRIYPWGNAFIDAAEVVIWRENSRRLTAKVGTGIRTRGASWVGALDMAGNAWQWTSSLNHPYPYQATDGREDLTSGDERIMRGGAWFNGPDFIRSAFRYYNYPHDRYGYVGARYLRPLT